jgi:hypothetical protein
MLLVITMSAHASDKQQQIHDLAKAITNEVDAKVEAQLALAKSVQDGAQAPIDRSQLNDINMTPEFDVLANNEGAEDSVLWQALQEAQANMNLAEMKQTRYPTDMYIYLLVSMSIPAENLKGMMYDMAFAYPDKQIVLVFQGALNNDVESMVQYLYRYMPDDMSVPIVIDPIIFNAFEPPGVPFYAIQIEPDNWKGVLGNVPISQAIQYAEKPQYDGKPVGRLYPIVEPNMLDEIHAKIRSMDWEKIKQTSKDKLLAKQQTHVELPDATQSYSYLVDMTVTIEQDIVAHNDEVIVAQGEQINPLRYMPLSKHYIFVDADNDTHIPLLRYLKAQHPLSTVISTTLPEAAERKALFEEFGEIYHLDPLLAERFGLERVPSIAYQHKDMLAVDVLAIADFNKATQAIVSREE